MVCTLYFTLNYSLQNRQYDGYMEKIISVIQNQIEFYKMLDYSKSLELEKLLEISELTDLLPKLLNTLNCHITICSGNLKNEIHLIRDFFEQFIDTHYEISIVGHTHYGVHPVVFVKLPKDITKPIYDFTKTLSCMVEPGQYLDPINFVIFKREYPELEMTKENFKKLDYDMRHKLRLLIDQNFHINFKDTNLQKVIVELASYITIQLNGIKVDMLDKKDIWLEMNF